MRPLRTICWICAFLGMLQLSIPARSQTSDTNTQTPGSAPAQSPESAPSPAPEQPALKPAELDALVAPIALYPDPLLANVLMASTYPLEVVEAERWVNQNKKLKGDALKAAAEKQRGRNSIRLLIGGLHLYDQRESDIRPVIADLQRLHVESIIPTHCTGDLATRLIMQAFPGRYDNGGAGKKITLDR